MSDLGFRRRGETDDSIRPHHLEHGIRPDLEIIALAAGAHDGVRQRGLVDTILDEGLVDVHGNDLAEGEPGLRLLAVGALQLNDLRQPAFERHRLSATRGSRSRKVNWLMTVDVTFFIVKEER